MPQYEIICLANSRKRGGRCLAGLRTDDGGWVRPVSAQPGGELQPSHTQFKNGEARAPGRLNIGLAKPSAVAAMCWSSTRNSG